MAFVTLASSLTLVSLRLQLNTRYRKEEDPARRKDASLLTRTLLHHRRTAAMADDEHTTLPHRIRQREVNLPRIQWRSSCKMTFLFSLLSALDTTLNFTLINTLPIEYLSPLAMYISDFNSTMRSFMFLQIAYTLL